MAEGREKRVVVTRLEDRSLEAYKNWINSFVAALKGEDPETLESSLTEEQWREKHKRFWEKTAAP